MLSPQRVWNRRESPPPRERERALGGRGAPAADWDDGGTIPLCSEPNYDKKYKLPASTRAKLRKGDLVAVAPQRLLPTKGRGISTPAMIFMQALLGREETR